MTSEAKKKREERMRGDHSEPDAIFSYISPAQRVPQDHPLRAVRTLVDYNLQFCWFVGLTMDQEAKLYFTGHVVMQNRNGLAVGGRVTQATGAAERETALKLLEDIPRRSRITVGGDKGCDVRAFVEALRKDDATPHIARKVRYSAIDDRTTRHETYMVSQRSGKRVEEIFGWLKTVGMMRKTKHRGLPRVDWVFTFALAVYNLVRI